MTLKNRKRLKSCSGDKSSALLVFASAPEVQTRPTFLGGVRNVHSEKSALQLIGKIDRARTFQGFCGR